MMRATTYGVVRACRRRAGVYIAVLGASVIVLTVGLSALLAVRIQGRGIRLSQDAVHARFGARSALEFAHFLVSADPTWRSTYTHDTWVGPITLDDRMNLEFKLVDELDGDLTGDSSQPVRLFAKATVGDVVRIESAELAFPEDNARNRLTNPGFESSRANWSSWNCTLFDAALSHSGANSVLLKLRATLDATAYQDITSTVENGESYYVEVWAWASGGTEKISISIKTTATTSGVRTFITPSVLVGSQWTLVSGVLTPTWSGTLTEARWRVFSFPDGGTKDFWIDDAVLIIAHDKVLHVVPGSSRQEVLP